MTLEGFQVVDLMTVDATALVATNVVETAPAAYNSGTTYALAATASVDLGAGLLDVFTSLQGLNTNHTPASSPLWWKKTGSTVKLYSGATAYAVDDYALDATNHLIFQKLTAGTGHALPTAAEGWDNANWLRVRASNRYAMFDAVNSSQTTNPDSIVVQVRAAGLVNGVALTNISAATARVRMLDDVEGVVFDETFDLAEYSGIDDFAPWFFSPPSFREKLPIVALPPYADALIEVSLLDPGYVVGCGTCAIGPITEIGGTQWNPKLGFTNFSLIAQNDFGDRDIVERGYTDNGEFIVLVDNAKLDFVLRFFKARRARPLLLQADDRWDAMQVFGIVQDCTMEVPGDDISYLSLSLGGMS